MRKILFAIISFSFMFTTSCSKMEDIDAEIKDLQDLEEITADFLRTRPSAPAEYTLTDEDYALSSNEGVAKYKNFSSYDLPKDYLPEILYKKFSGENAQSMMVTYNFYSKPVVDMDNSRSISDDEYEEMGAGYGNFSDEAEAEALIGKLLGRKVYAEEAGVEITIDYTLFATNQTRYVKVNQDLTVEILDYYSDAVEVTSEQYTSLGSTYGNFYSVEEASTLLVQLATDENTYPIVYSCDVYKNYLTEYLVFLYDGKEWNVKTSLMAVSEELNYSVNESDITLSYWWADPAIKITLGAADYDLETSTSKYKNFDLRSGQTPGTDVNARVQMIGNMLDTNHGPIIEDQQYLVTYLYYDGGSGIGSDRIIKIGGAWQMYVAPAE